jgi:uncharacterized protein
VDQKGRICIFAKPCKAGVAKTRLAPLVGMEGAAVFAEAFLLDICTAVRCLVWAKPTIASIEPLPPTALPQGFEEWLQGDGDLGTRLERVLGRALSDSAFAIALGADSPGLPLRYLEQARAILVSADAVLGPCDDGGFYLLGLRRCPAGLLAGISWSQPSTFAQTLARLKEAGLRVAVLERWFDVDRPEDFLRLRGLIASGEVRAPETQKAFVRVRVYKPVGDPPSVSIIIPVLNEREILPHTLAELQRHKWVREVIVVDGGSSDRTREWLSEQSFAHVVDAPRARGAQMNAGAKTASGDVLLFLHADCVLPFDAIEQIRTAMSRAGVVGGCFLVRFRESRSLSLRLVEAGINLRTRLTRTATGDQAIFVRRRAFGEAGGCPDWPLFEDVKMVSRMKELGRFMVVRSTVTISARRFITRGVWKSVALIYALRAGYWAGISPVTLKKWFDDVRPHLGTQASRPRVRAEKEEASHAVGTRA